MPVPAGLRTFVPVDDVTFDTLPPVARDALIESAYRQVDSHVNEVRSLYRELRALPSFLAMSQEQRRLARRSAEMSPPVVGALSVAPTLQNEYVDMISYMRDITRRSRGTTKIPRYNIEYGEQHEVRFLSRRDHEFRSYLSSTHNMRFETAIVLTETTLPMVRDLAYRLVDDVRSEYPNAHVYQVILTATEGHNAYYNSTPDSLHSDLEGIVEKYTGYFCVNTISVRVTHGTSSGQLVRDMSIEAGSGEGIPFELSFNVEQDGRSAYHTYWVADLVETPSNCMLYAYRIWQAYRQGEHALLEILNKSIRSHVTTPWRREIRALGVNPVDGIYNIADIQRAYPHQFCVISSKAELEKLLPTAQDTRKICHYYYDCGHVAVLMHPDAMTRDMKQRFHYLSRKSVLNVARPKPHRTSQQPFVVVVDIECYRQPTHEGNSTVYKHIPLMIGMLAGYSDMQEYTYWKGHNCVRELFDGIGSEAWPNDRVIIWMHNGGGYDVHLIFDEILHRALPEGREPVRVTDLDGTLISVSFKMMNSATGRPLEVVFRDSCRLLPVPLNDLATSYGLEGKLTEGIDIKNVTRQQLLNDLAYEDYLRRDCEILHTVLLRYQQSMLKDGYSDPLAFSTQSSFVKHTFFERFYPTKTEPKYPIFTLPRWLHEYIDRAYRGGRNELFHRGVIQAPLYVYDFTSLYPYVGTFDLPYGVPRMGHLGIGDIGVEATTESTSHMFGFVEVIIDDTPRNILPYYGTRKHHSYIFDYLSGERAVITTVELQRMVELGYKIRMIKYVQYDRAPLLKEMFKTLFTTKQEANAANDTAKALTAKLAAVSGYGFFGFDKYDRHVLRIYHPDKEENVLAQELSGTAMYRRDASGLLITNEKVHVHLRDTNVAIAAFITAYARDTLYTLMTDIEAAGGKVYYCDTDSVFTNLRIEDHEVLCKKWMGPGMGTNLGELKREYERQEIQEAVLATLKVYGLRFEDDSCTVKIKGVKKSTPTNDRRVNQARDYEDLKRAIEQGHEHIVRTTNIFCKSRGQKLDTDRSNLEERERAVFVSLEYNKGIVQSNGSIHPLSGRRQ